ncbi:unnamed protein product [Cuscuta epithymum]|uniref:Uncharacterized protein n=1 Tax=Cuscuta epithymum TaxID=186058 RepID=A0AAV0FJY5_9ASTE|nr:unnamed protein product [Cuscuta epithymum]
MEKYFGNAYRGDPGVPHSDPSTFWSKWIGAAGFSAVTWFNPYMWQLTNEYNRPQSPGRISPAINSGVNSGRGWCAFGSDINLPSSSPQHPDLPPRKSSLPPHPRAATCRCSWTRNQWRSQKNGSGGSKINYVQNENVGMIKQCFLSSTTGSKHGRRTSHISLSGIKCPEKLETHTTSTGLSIFHRVLGFGDMLI